MKNCPKCHKSYDDSWAVCVSCSVPLDDALESRLKDLEGQARLILSQVESIRRGEPLPAHSSVPRTAAKEVKKIPASKPTPAEGVEVLIGKYWLNKIGIISMVAGVAFFVSYAFTYLSPVWRIGIGYLISAAMILAGRAMDKMQKYKWYGRGIIAGGWVLVYFTTFAMHFIPATRIISSRPLDMALLSVVVAVMVADLLKFRSESLVMLVMTLGYVTAGINETSFLAFIYVAVLAAASCLLLVRMKWQTLSALSLLGTYVTHIIWRRSYHFPKPGAEEFWISILFLGLYWAIYNASALFSRVDDAKDRRNISAFILANSVLFGLVLFSEVNFYHPAWKTLAASAPAMVLLLFAALTRSNGKQGLRASYEIAAIAFLSVSLRYMATSQIAYLVWFCEIPALLWLGLYFKEKFYRFAAWALTLVTLGGMATVFEASTKNFTLFGKEFPFSFVLYLVSIASFCLARYMYVRPPQNSDVDQQELQAANVYTIMASVTIMIVSYTEINPSLLTLSWALSAFFLFFAGFVLKDRFFRYAAIALVASAIFRGLIIDMAGVNTVYRIAIFLCLGLILLGVSFWYTRMAGALSETKIADERSAKKLPVILVALISLSILFIAHLYPSEYRREEALNEKERSLSADFIAKKVLSPEDIRFLKDRKFKSIEKILWSLPLGEDGRNLEVYQRVLEIGAGGVGVYNRLGGYYEKKKDWTKAIHYYQKGIDLDAGLNQWTTRSMVRSLAQLYKKQSDYERAARLYETYLAYGKNVQDLYELATCYEHLGQLDKALEKINIAISMDRDGVYSSDMRSYQSTLYSQKERSQSTVAVKASAAVAVGAENEEAKKEVVP